MHKIILAYPLESPQKIADERRDHLLHLHGTSPPYTAVPVIDVFASVSTKGATRQQLPLRQFDFKSDSPTETTIKRAHPRNREPTENKVCFSRWRAVSLFVATVASPLPELVLVCLGAAGH